MSTVQNMVTASESFAKSTSSDGQQVSPGKEGSTTNALSIPENDNINDSNFKDMCTDKDIERHARFRGTDEGKFPHNHYRHQEYHDTAAPPEQPHFPTFNMKDQESLEDRLHQAMVERDEAIYREEESNAVLSNILSGIRILTRRMKKVHTFSPCEEEGQEGFNAMEIPSSPCTPSTVEGDMRGYGSSHVTDIDAWNHGGRDNRIYHSPLTPSTVEYSYTPPTSAGQAYNSESSLFLPAASTADCNRSRTWSNMSAQSISSVKSYTSSEDEFRLSHIISDLSGTEAGIAFDALHNVCTMVGENARLVSTEAGAAVEDSRVAEEAARVAEQRANMAAQAAKKLHKERQRLKKDVERFKTERSLLLGRVKDLLKQKKNEVAASMKRGVEGSREEQETNLLRGLEEHVAEALLFHEKNLCKRRSNSEASVDSCADNKPKVKKNDLVKGEKDNCSMAKKKLPLKSSLVCEKSSKLPHEGNIDDPPKEKDFDRVEIDVPQVFSVVDREQKNKTVKKKKDSPPEEGSGIPKARNLPTKAKKVHNHLGVLNEKPSRKMSSIKEEKRGEKTGGANPFSKGFSVFVEIISANHHQHASNSPSIGTAVAPGGSSVFSKLTPHHESSQAAKSVTGPSSTSVEIIVSPSEQGGKKAERAASYPPASTSCSSHPQERINTKLPPEHKMNVSASNNTSQKDQDQIRNTMDKDEGQTSAEDSILPTEKKEHSVADREKEYEPLHLQEVACHTKTKPNMVQNHKSFLNAFNRVGGGCGGVGSHGKQRCLLDISNDDAKDADDLLDSTEESRGGAQQKLQSDTVAHAAQCSSASPAEKRYGETESSSSPNRNPNRRPLSSSLSAIDRVENERYFRSLAVPRIKSPSSPSLSFEESLDADCEQLPSLPKLSRRKGTCKSVAIQYSPRSRNKRFVGRIAAEPRSLSCPPRTRA
uniref:Uncharacterized protein n=2 Tax=Ditylum brightwellii TaxID=49249 RepID=A0A7S4VCA6_9STRA